jgi:hypothetical protein
VGECCQRRCALWFPTPANYGAEHAPERSRSIDVYVQTRFGTVLVEYLTVDADGSWKC